MRGLRRGRNRSGSEDESGSEDAAVPTGGGAVKLVETSVAATPPVAEDGDAEPSTPGEGSVAPSATPTPMNKTRSDVATAHAHLDSVLPPSGESSPEDAASTVKPGPPEGAATVAARASDTPVSTAAVTVEPAVEVATSTGDPSPSDPVVDDVASEAKTPGEEPQAASGNPLPRVLAVANQKGGVGKTTTSVNLGAALAELGFRVLVIDLDPQGNATTGLGIDARTFELSMYDVLMRDASLEDCVEPTSMKNLFVAPATIALAGAEIELVPAFSRELKLKKSIESVIDDFDYVLIDCPPSLGLITVNALAAADEVLVPIQCEYYALEGLSQLMRNVHLVASNLNPKLDISTIVLTMYDARTKLADQVANEVRQHFGAKVCRNVIPRTVRLSEAPSFGQPITAFDPASRGAIAYRGLAKEVSGGAS
jgi:chromosome partitioning protein